MTYNYLIIGAGLFGVAFAQQARAAGKTVLVVDKRPHVGGNVYTERIKKNKAGTAYPALHNAYGKKPDPAL